MRLVWIDFLPSGEVAGSLWAYAGGGGEYHVPTERRLPFSAGEKLDFSKWLTREECERLEKAFREGIVK